MLQVVNTLTHLKIQLPIFLKFLKRMYGDLKDKFDYYGYKGFSYIVYFAFTCFMQG